jgi:OOP family OmpA-OmpF porin
MIFNRIKANNFYSALVLAGLSFPLAAEAQAQQEIPITPDTVVNSRFNEVKPIFSPDGSTLYFTRSNHPLNSGGRRDRGDVWQANVLAPGRYGEVKLADRAFNSSQMNSIVGFSENGQEVYFQTYDTESKGKRQAGIYKMPGGGGKAQPVTIHYFFNKAKYQDATLSPDGKVMLLAMESYSTYGLEDLYVSFLQPDGSWSEPKNLGLEINTPKQEMSAWLAADGQTLYFTSNGHGGHGSMDIFRSQRLDGSWKRWSKPENLGPEVNDAGADMYYSESPQGEWAYYSSTQNSEGFGDIRKTPIPEQEDKEPLLVEAEEEPLSPEATADTSEMVAAVESNIEEDSIEEVTVLVKQSFEVEGQVQNEAGQPQPAQLRISRPGIDYSDSRAISGSFDVNLPEGGEYRVKVQAQGYYPVDTSLRVSEGVNALNLRLRPLVVGETVRLENVMFRQSTAVLMEESNEALDEVVSLMQENPQMEILVTGHTDNQGSSKANIRLSRERVEAVKNYLVSRGIEEERIEGKGYGPTRPIASNASEETRKLNRRVEFTITRK